MEKCFNSELTEHGKQVYPQSSCKVSCLYQAYENQKDQVHKVRHNEGSSCLPKLLLNLSHSLCPRLSDYNYKLIYFWGVNSWYPQSQGRD